MGFATDTTAFKSTERYGIAWSDPRGMLQKNDKLPSNKPVEKQSVAEPKVEPQKSTKKTKQILAAKKLNEKQRLKRDKKVGRLK